MKKIVEEEAASSEPASTPDGLTGRRQRAIDTHLTLPDKPLVRFTASKTWVPLNLRDLWAHRELFYFLMWRDVKVRYKQTVLGAAWAILQPLCAMIVFYLLFGRLARISSAGIPYPLFAYAGLLPWTFFSNALMNSGNSLVGNSNLITKVYFPRMLLPGAAAVAGLVEFAIAFMVLIVLMIYYRVGLTWNILMLPIFTLLMTLLAVGVGMWVSALNVKYRDVRFALPFLIQLWFFGSPIIYPVGLVPSSWVWVLMLNPMTGIIDGFRSSLFGRRFNWQAIVTSVIITLLTLLFSAYTFRRMEKSFTDLV